MKAPKMGSMTPWGPAQIAEVIKRNEDGTPGIVQVETSSHGGVWVSTELLAKMDPALLMKSDFFKGGPWFEEDCEIARVAYAYPEAFEYRPAAEVRELALKSLRFYRPDIVAALKEVAP